MTASFLGYLTTLLQLYYFYSFDFHECVRKDVGGSGPELFRVPGSNFETSEDG